MGYDPFAAGTLSVAVRSGEAIDPARGDRRLPFDVWYPENDGTLTRPLVVYSHASYGHRRQSSLLCAHLASHGYVVAAADHSGNTAADFAERSARLATGELRPRSAEEAAAYLGQIIADRVPDLRFLLDQLLSGGVWTRIDKARIGLAGWSFGGWAVLAAPEADDRIRAVVALAPAGNSKPLPGIIPATLTFDWKRDVPTLFLVAERDRFTPLAGQYELFERTRSSKRMFILRGADHEHFGDQVDDPGACPPEHAHLFARGLALAHFDAFLKEQGAAREFMAGDVVGALRRNGVEAADPEP
jgi:dienelactone hydrolase